jgi:hypothetical protein
LKYAGNSQRIFYCEENGILIFRDESEEFMSKRIRKWIILSLLLGASIITGCGTLQVEVEPTLGAGITSTQVNETPAMTMAIPTQTAIPTGSPTLEPTATATSQPEASSQWREVRDPGTGFGFALPCWWITYMPTGESLNYAITVASYDENYFLANSVKGQWLGGQRPQGAYKLDFILSKQIDASLTDEEAVRQALTSEENKVDLVQMRTVGRHTALLAIQSSVNNPSSTGTVYAFRLAPTDLLMVSAAPASDLTDPVVQAILNSLALSQDEEVEQPTIDPGPALIARPAACQS